MTDEYLKAPSKTEHDVPERVLVVVAHPDDVDFGSGGTVATWTSKGCYVCYCIVTDGAAGSQDPTIGLPRLVEVRKDEQRAAAATVGVKDVTFLGYPDGRLVPSLEVRRDIVREIRRMRPDRVVCQSPERNYDRIRSSHPDHLAAGEATLCAVYPDARNPYAYPELLEQEALEPFEVPEVWMMAAPLADRYVDITEHIEEKISALLCHRSQISEPGRLGEMIRSLAMSNAESVGLEKGRLAEVFRAIDTK